jgi:hypothetical protein
MYHKVGTTLRSYVTIVDPGGSFVTGLTSSDVTIRLTKNTTGNQATTGVTFSEVDATNNPGVYAIVVSGATGFVAATGNYHLSVFRTADGEEYGKEADWIVTSDGTGAGTWGDASFTPSTGNGRYTDGTDPLENVVVRIADSSGDIWVRTLTDSNGLYPTVYFPADGVYTVRAQLSGYSSALYTITVSGGVATGPGADSVMTISTTSTTILASELTTYAHRAYFDHTGNKADSEVYDIVNDAITRVCDEYHWTFMHKVSQVIMRAQYATGTISITEAGTTVTLVGGVFPSWAASGEIYVDGQFYPVTSRTDDTHVELAQAFGSASITGETYTITQIGYDLPSRCAMLDEILWPDAYTRPRRVSKALFDIQKNGYSSVTSSNPGIWSFGDQKIYVLPALSVDRSVNILYYEMPDEVISTSDVIVMPRFMLPILRKAITVEACMRSSGESAYASLRQAQQEYEISIEKAVKNLSQEPVDGQLRVGGYDDYDLSNGRVTG